MSRSVSVLSWVPMAQGLYYIAGGLWPLLSMSTFESVTGDKTDEWLVRTVGLYLVITGLALAFAGLRRRITPEIVILGIGMALVTAGIDVYYSLMGVLPGTYLVDAVAELALVAGWLFGGRRRAKVEVKEVKVDEEELAREHSKHQTVQAHPS